MEVVMIPNNLQNNKTPFRIIQSSLIGIPSPSALKLDNFPGVTIGSDPAIGKQCIIFGNVFIGNRFRCGDNVFIRENTSVGDDVIIGNRSCVESNVMIADRVTIGDNVIVPSFTRIGRQVCISSNVQLLTGPSTASGRTRGIILEDNCVIGKNAVIGPCTCIGANAIVDDNAVITVNVPGRSLQSP